MDTEYRNIVLLCRNSHVPAVDVECDHQAVLMVLMEDAKNLHQRLLSSLSWVDFTTAARHFRFRYAHMEECKDVVRRYLSTAILLCWFHVKAAWHDNLLTKVSK